MIGAIARCAWAIGLVALAACGSEPSDAPPAEPGIDSRTATEPLPPHSDSASDSILVGDPPTAVPGPLTAPPRTWTTQTTQVSRQSGVSTLRDVRVATHGGFDRVVFTFEGDVPGYHVEYVDRPSYTCGSGEAVYLDGDAWLLVRMRPAQAHTDAGEPTIGERRRRFGMPVLREGMMTCDFEADVSWVLGLTAPGGYQLAELDKPSRLVVDVRR
jgi:hypothetical protein